MANPPPGPGNYAPPTSAPVPPGSHPGGYPPNVHPYPAYGAAPMYHYPPGPPGAQFFPPHAPAMPPHAIPPGYPPPPTGFLYSAPVHYQYPPPILPTVADVRAPHAVHAVQVVYGAPPAPGAAVYHAPAGILHPMYQMQPAPPGAVIGPPPSSATPGVVPTPPPSTTPSAAAPAPPSSRTPATTEPSVNTAPPSTTSPVPRSEEKSHSSSGFSLMRKFSLLFGGPVKKSLSENQTNPFTRQFQAIPKRENGFLSKEEFCLAFLGKNQNAFLADHLFCAFDRNHDGKISEDEYVEGILCITAGTDEERLNFAFNIYDTDYDGIVSHADVTRAISALKGLFSAIEVRLSKTLSERWDSFAAELFKVCDADGDERLSREEFVRGAAAHPELFERLIGRATLGMATTVFSGGGVPITPGHPKWLLVVNITIGLRYSIESVQGKDADFEYLTPSDISAKASFSLPLVPAPAMAADANAAAGGGSGGRPEFFDCSPMYFKVVRNLSRIDEPTYAASLGPDALLGGLLSGTLAGFSVKGSDGSSGSVFYFTADGRFLVKTIPKDECEKLELVRRDYLNHLHAYPCSLLVRYFGLHRIDSVGSFVVMENLFFSEKLTGKMAEVYDLKGSTVDRSNKSGRGPLKDLDFTRAGRKVRIGAARRAMVLTQLHQDSMFLKANSIMDYSLLVGVYRASPEEMEALERERTLMGATQDKVPFTREFFGGMRGEENGRPSNEIYFIGIIDMLTVYGLKKKGESLAKSFVHNKHNISSVPPEEYQPRFMKFMECVFE